MRIDLSKYKRSNSFYTSKMFLVTIKSYDLQKIRERYLKSKQNKTGRVGSVERREISNGGLAFIEIREGEIIKSEILSYLPEPRGVDLADNMVAVSSENKVYVFSHEKMKLIEDPWFSYIHTVKFNRWNDPDHLLISSSGLDCIFEYNLNDFDKSWEWFAWENGFNKGFDPDSKEDIILTRNHDEATAFLKTGVKHKLINEPLKQSLPTAQ